MSCSGSNEAGRGSGALPQRAADRGACAPQVTWDKVDWLQTNMGLAPWYSRDPGAAKRPMLSGEHEPARDEGAHTLSRERSLCRSAGRVCRSCDSLDSEWSEKEHAKPHAIIVQSIPLQLSACGAPADKWAR